MEVPSPEPDLNTYQNKIHKISFQETGQFSTLFLDYIKGDQNVKRFFNLYPTLDNFEVQFKNKKFSDQKRKNLHLALKQQYLCFNVSPGLEKNISSLLNKNTFTVTTGHQLNLFTGPLYFIYKIVSIINTAKILNEKYSDCHFVPVYWMNSEDHDFQEINHFNLFGKKIVWDSDQKGAAGRFKTPGIEKLFQDISEKIPLMEEAYLKHNTLADAHRYLVNELFGSEGLIILNSDDKILKSEFKDIIKDELVSQTSFRLINETNKDLESKGYPIQVHPREINLFYLDDGIRERIVKEGEIFKVLNTDLSFTKEQIFSLVDSDPEKFSPNVVTRPLYQESILPNLAYTGGPGELIYWLQYKNVFEHYDLECPILMPRNFMLVIPKAIYKKTVKLGISLTDLFLPMDKLKSKFIEMKKDKDLDIKIEERELEEMFGKLSLKVSLLDKSLEGFVLAERQKALKILEGIEKKVRKAYEDKLKVEIDQLIAAKTKLFPGDGLQERTDNFLNFYLNDPAFLEKLKNSIQPFDFSFHILTDNE
jgi:bacillithiol biosynthesis cysteine-adding enzyme BshC